MLPYMCLPRVSSCKIHLQIIITLLYLFTLPPQEYFPNVEIFSSFVLSPQELRLMHMATNKIHLVNTKIRCMPYLAWWPGSITLRSVTFGDCHHLLNILYEMCGLLKSNVYMPTCHFHVRNNMHYYSNYQLESHLAISFINSTNHNFT